MIALGILAFVLAIGFVVGIVVYDRRKRMDRIHAGVMAYSGAMRHMLKDERQAARVRHRVR